MSRDRIFWRINGLEAEYPGLGHIHVHSHRLHVRPAIDLQAREVWMGDSGAIEVELRQRPIDREFMVMTLNDQDLSIEGVRFARNRADDGLEGSTLVAKRLVERV